MVLIAPTFTELGAAKLHYVDICNAGFPLSRSRNVKSMGRCSYTHNTTIRKVRIDRFWRNSCSFDNCCEEILHRIPQNPRSCLPAYTNSQTYGRSLHIRPSVFSTSQRPNTLVHYFIKNPLHKNVSNPSYRSSIGTYFMPCVNFLQCRPEKQQKRI
jgi:hypothetical protein